MILSKHILLDELPKWLLQVSKAILLLSAPGILHVAQQL
jgi:hypothetical protein